MFVSQHREKYRRYIYSIYNKNCYKNFQAFMYLLERLLIFSIPSGEQYSSNFSIYLEYCLILLSQVTIKLCTIKRFWNVNLCVILTFKREKKFYIPIKMFITSIKTYLDRYLIIFDLLSYPEKIIWCYLRCI